MSSNLGCSLIPDVPVTPRADTFLYVVIPVSFSPSGENTEVAVGGGEVAGGLEIGSGPVASNMDVEVDTSVVHLG